VHLVTRVHFWSRDKMAVTPFIRHSGNLNAARKFRGCLFYRIGVTADRSVYITAICMFDLFRSCGLDLDPTTFIYKPDPYSLQMYMYQMCENERPTSRLSKVVV